MIQAFRLFRTFGPNVALNNLNFRVRKGEFVFITGPSGAGKTTLLRLIFGAEKPTSGHMLINGINLNRIRRLKLDLLRRDIGFVFQDFKLLPRKTVFENVALALEVTGERPGFIRKKTHQTLRLVGLAEKEKAFPLQISGGEQQRVAIARAIVKGPVGTFGLRGPRHYSPWLTKDIMVLFRSIHMKGTTVIVATHSRELLEDTAQRTIVLNCGRIVEE